MAREKVKRGEKDQQRPVLLVHEPAPCAVSFESGEKFFSITGKDACEVMALLAELSKTRFVARLLEESA